MTKWHRLNLTQGTFIFTQFGSQKPKIKVRAEFGSRRSSLPDFRWLPSCSSSQSLSPLRGRGFSHRATDAIRSGPTLWPHLTLTSSLTIFPPNAATLGTQTWPPTTEGMNRNWLGPHHHPEFDRELMFWGDNLMGMLAIHLYPSDFVPVWSYQKTKVCTLSPMPLIFANVYYKNIKSK